MRYVFHYRKGETLSFSAAAWDWLDANGKREGDERGGWDQVGDGGGDVESAVAPPTVCHSGGDSYTPLVVTATANPGRIKYVSFYSRNQNGASCAACTTTRRRIR